MSIFIQDLIHFWLGKGVDGFRMDAVKHIFEAEHLRDEPQVDPNKPPVGELVQYIYTCFDLNLIVAVAIFLLPF